MKLQTRNLISMVVRYLFLLLVGMGNLYIFYRALMPLTIRTVGLVLSVLTDTSVYGNVIQTPMAVIEIVPACTIGSAFFLILILIFSINKVRPMDRVKITIISFALLFVLNIIRIVFLFFVINTTYFSAVHWVFWNFISTIMVVVIWVAMVKLYKVEDIPFVSDIRYIKSLVKPRKKTKGKKKNK